MQSERRWPRFLRQAAPLVALLGLLGVVGSPGTNPAAAAAAAPAVVSADLALVPADAVAFAHIRVADVWKSDMMSAFRSSIEKAGPKALAALEEQIVPPPSSFDRITAFVTFSDRGPEPFGIVSFNRPMNAEQLAKAIIPNHTTKKVGTKTVYVCDCGLAAYFPTDRQVVLAQPEALLKYVGQPVATEGSMKAAMALAETRPIVMAGNIAALPIPPQAFEQLPPNIVPLLKVQSLMLSMDLAGDPRLFLEAGYKDAAAVADAEKALGAAKQMAKEQTAKFRTELEGKLYDPKQKKPRPADQYPEVLASVLGIGAMNRLDELIDNPGIVKRGNSLAFDVTIPKEIVNFYGAYSAVAVGLLLPAVQKVRDAASRAQGMNNLKQIGIAIHNYHDAHGRLPEDIKDKNGKPLLSWRVAILPFIEQEALYRQFKLNEPWDSPTNKTASQVMVRTFTSPTAIPVPMAPGAYGMTHYKGVSGPGTAFDPKGKIRLQEFTDGTSNTVMVVESADAIPWAKPGDFEFDPKKPVPKFAFPGKEVFAVLIGDGSVRSVSKSVSEATLKAAFTRSGGEVLGADW